MKFVEGSVLAIVTRITKNGGDIKLINRQCLDVLNN